MKEGQPIPEKEIGKVPVKITMSREDDVLRFLSDIDLNNKEITTRELSSNALQNNLRKMYNC